jgi:hypothetical protein
VTILQGRLLAVRAGRDRREATWRNPRLFPTIEKGPGSLRRRGQVGPVAEWADHVSMEDRPARRLAAAGALTAVTLHRAANRVSVRPICHGRVAQITPQSLARCHPKHRPPKSSIIAAASNPGRNHRHIVRVEGHQVGAISGGELAEHVSETDRHRRIC